MLTTLVLLAACTGTPTTTPEPAPPAPAPQQDTGVVAHMAEHFQKATIARDALIAGDLDASRAALEWIATHQEADGLPAGSGAYVERMRATARAGAEATSAKAVGRAVAGLGHACGECHTSVGAEPVPSPAAKGGDPMHDHLRASDLMWWGLVGPQAGAWVEAAPIVQATSGVDVIAADAAGKMEMYGDWIASCAACHAEKGVGPGK